jgi:hypothetical protein
MSLFALYKARGIVHVMQTDFEESVVEIELNEIDDFSGNNSNQGNNMGWT